MDKAEFLLFIYLFFVQNNAGRQCTVIFFSCPISSILMLSSQIETRSIWRECIMKSSLGFLDSCGTNAPAGPANEFNLSAQLFSSPIHLLISCKWVFAVEVPVNKSTACTLLLQQTIITWKHPDCVCHLSGRHFACSATASGNMRERRTASWFSSAFLQVDSFLTCLNGLTESHVSFPLHLELYLQSPSTGV